MAKTPNNDPSAYSGQGQDYQLGIICGFLADIVDDIEDRKKQSQKNGGGASAGDMSFMGGLAALVREGANIITAAKGISKLADAINKFNKIGAQGVDMFAQSMDKIFGVLAKYKNMKDLQHVESIIKAVNKLMWSIVGITAIIVLLAVIDWKLAVGAFVGLVAVTLLVAGLFKLILMVFPKDKMEDVSESIKAVTSAFVKIALVVTVLMLVSLLFDWGQLIKGIVMVVAVFAAVAGMFKIISWLGSKEITKNTTDALLNIGIALGMLILDFIILTLITYIFPMKTLLAALAIMGGFVIGMVLFLFGLSFVEKRIGDKGSGAVKTLIDIAMVIGLFIIDLLLLAIIVTVFGMETVALAGLVLVGFMTLVMGLTYALKLVSKGTGTAQRSAENIAILLLTLIVSYVILLFIVDNFSGDTMLIAGALLVAFTGIALGVTWAFSKILKKGDVVKATATATSVAILIGSITLAAFAFVFLANYLQTRNITTKSILITGAIMSGFILASIGIMWALSKINMSTMAKGGLVLAGLVIFLGALLGLTFVFTKLAAYIDSASEGKDKNEFFGTPALIMLGLISGAGLIVAAFGALMLIPFLPVVMAAGMAVVAGLSLLLYGLIELTDAFVDVSIRVAEHNITQDTIDTFVNLVGGADGQGLLGAMCTIMKNISNFDMGGLSGYFKTKTVLDNLEKLLGIVGSFMDIVLKFANFQYISGYNEDGTPIFGKYSTEDFTAAAQAISESFNNFMNTVVPGLQALSPVMGELGFWFMYKLKKLVDIVGKFTKVVLDVSKSVFIIGYDENDKPIYEKVQPSDFTSAAEAIGNGFGLFLNGIKQPLADLEPVLDDISGWFLNKLGKTVGVVSSFADIIFRYLSNTIPDLDPEAHPGESLYKEDGTPKFFKLITPEMYTQAAKAVTDSFATFLRQLVTTLNSSEMLDLIEDVVDALEDIGPVLDGVARLTDAILNMAKLHPYLKDSDGNIMYLTDKDGNKDFTKPLLDYSKTIDTAAAGTNIASMFTNFLSAMVTKFADEDFTDNLEEMMDLLSDKDFEKTLNNIVRMSDMLVGVATKLSANTEENKVYEMMNNRGADGVPIVMKAYLDSINALLTYLSNTTVFVAATKLESIGTNMVKGIQKMVEFVETMNELYGTINASAEHYNVESFNVLCETLVRGISNFADDTLNVASENFAKSSQYLADAITNINKFSFRTSLLLGDFQSMKPLADNFVETSKKMCEAISAFTDNYLSIAAANLKQATNGLSTGANNLKDFVTSMDYIFDEFGSPFKIFKFRACSADVISALQLYLTESAKDSIEGFKTITSNMATSAKDLQSFTDTIYDIVTKFEDQETGIGNFNEICKKLVYGIQQFATIALPDNEVVIATSLQKYEKDLKAFTKNNNEMNESLKESTSSVRTFSDAIKNLHYTLAVQGKEIGDMMNKTTEHMKEMIHQMSYLIGGMKNIANTDFDNTTSSLRNIKEELCEIIQKMEDSGMTGQAQDIEQGGGDGTSSVYGTPGGSSTGATGDQGAYGGGYGGYAGSVGGGTGDVVISSISPTAISQLKKLLGK